MGLPSTASSRWFDSIVERSNGENLSQLQVIAACALGALTIKPYTQSLKKETAPIVKATGLAHTVGQRTHTASSASLITSLTLGRVQNILLSTTKILHKINDSLGLQAGIGRE